MFEDKKSIRKPIKNIYIPEKDENISTREVKKVTSTNDRYTAGVFKKRYRTLQCSRVLNILHTEIILSQFARPGADV